MLVLFDIDGTMLSSEGIGVRSMEKAGEVLFGKRFSLKDIPIGGRLDPLIWNDICLKYGIAEPGRWQSEFRKTYASILEQDIQKVKVTILPGVETLLERCHADESMQLGIVTGNWEEPGRCKLNAAGIDASLFTHFAWGSDGQERADLPPVAIGDFDGPTVLICDTVHDVTSGQASDCKVIAVCTGSHSRDTLHVTNPDLLVEDLSQTDEVYQWIIQHQSQ